MNGIPHASGSRRKATWWLAVAALLALELGVLSLAAVPRVSAAYSDFYIRQNTLCLATDGLPMVELGRTVSATSRFALSQCVVDAGWLKPRTVGTFLRGERGNLVFRVAEAPAGDLRFSFIAFAIGRQPLPTVSVLADGKELGTVRLSPDRRRVQSVVIPRSAIDGDKLTLTIALRPDGRPQARRLSLLRWRLDPAEAPPLMAMAPPGYY